MTTKPPITCHVLNTVTGQPAAALPVTLSLIKPVMHSTAPMFTSTTNDDGRVLSWDLSTNAAHPGLAEVFEAGRKSVLQREGEADKGVAEAVSQALGGAESTKGKGEMVWALSFDVGEYFKGEGFWTEVEVRFKTDVAEAGGRSHWHVPLLLSPWSYTTYRGS